jgi:hypothetical protein
MPKRSATQVRLGMVGWYDPQVLARSAWLVGLANIFGRHSDTRLIEALATQPQKEFDYSGNSDGLWLDYVSDIGDGWNPTCAIAQAVAQPELKLADAAGSLHDTSGGSVLVFGGDEVYPYPSREQYAARTEAPYAQAFADAARWPDVFALPGNHDWYDSLVAFSRVFCRPERGFAGAHTRQTRSYFALQLPANWWMLGIDLQLGADLDEPQVRYFMDVAARMSSAANVILCVPDPQWIYEKSYPDHPGYGSDVLRYFEREVLKRPVSVYLTGDLHFYKRHENEHGMQKIVSGGGGAFLHPTDDPDTERLHGGFVQRACYPPAATSRRLVWRNLLFPVLNPKYMWIPATLYMFSAWLASASLGPASISTVGDALHAAVTGAIRDPINGLWLIAFIASFVFFTDTHARWFRVLGGACHGAAHLAAAFGVGWLALIATTRWLGLGFGDVPQMLLAGLLTFIGGGIAGAFLLGIYLLISLRLFGRHATEAFSSLRIQDYKQWLRIRIEPDGVLRLFAIAIDRVPRRWVHRRQNERERLEPFDARSTRPRLIETLAIRPLGAGVHEVTGVDQRGRAYSRRTATSNATAPAGQA